jgi:hypothetical protein
MAESGKESTARALPSAKLIIDGTVRGLDRFQEMVGSTRDAETSRLIWYVAIAGYVVVNAEPYWSKLLGRPATGTDLFWLTLPWIAAAVASLVAHAAGLKRIDTEHFQFYAQRAKLDVYADIETDPERAVELAQSVLDTKDDLEKYGKATKWWTTVSALLRVVAFGFLLAAFVWTLAGPRCLR